MKKNFIANSELVNSYLKSIRKFSVLTPEQEKAVFIRIKNGDNDAKNIIANHNQRFVFSLAKQYAQDETVLDYVNEGNIGLMTAIDKFDYTRGYRFISYAKDLIRAYMNQYSYVSGLVQKSNNSKYAVKIREAKKEFYNENQRDPSVYELADIFKKKWNIDVVDLSDLATVSFAKLDKPSENDETEDSSAMISKSKTGLDLSTDNEYEKEITADSNDDIVSKLLNKLDERSRKVVKLSFGIGYEYSMCDDDIAEKLNLTTVRIRQIKNAAIKKMQNYKNLL